MDSHRASESGMLVRLLGPLAAEAERIGIPWLLIGAGARDLIFSEAGLHPASRATLDLDVAVQVSSWNEFAELKGALIDNKSFKADPLRPHRVHLQDGASLDIVPYGAIETDGKIRWQTKGAQELNVRGLRESDRSASRIAITKQLVVRVPTLQAFTALKLLTWEDRHENKPLHDARDLSDILDNAEDFVNFDELYAHHERCLEECEYEPSVAAVQVIGQRMHQELDTQTHEAVCQILEREANANGALTLARELGLVPQTRPQLQALLRGLRDPSPGHPT